MQVVPANESKTMKEMLSSVSEKGQVTIPLEIRRALDLKPRDKVAFTLEDGEVSSSLRPLPSKPVSRLSLRYVGP